MMLFRNVWSGETLTHIEFVTFVWEEAERQFNDCHDDENWCDLTKQEQLAIYCDQYEHQLDGDWKIINQ